MRFRPRDARLCAGRRVATDAGALVWVDRTGARHRARRQRARRERPRPPLVARRPTAGADDGADRRRRSLDLRSARAAADPARRGARQPLRCLEPRRHADRVLVGSGWSLRALHCCLPMAALDAAAAAWDVLSATQPSGRPQASCLVCPIDVPLTSVAARRRPEASSATWSPARTRSSTRLCRRTAVGSPTSRSNAVQLSLGQGYPDGVAVRVSRDGGSSPVGRPMGGSFLSSGQRDVGRRGRHRGEFALTRPSPSSPTRPFLQTRAARPFLRCRSRRPFSHDSASCRPDRHGSSHRGRAKLVRGAETTRADAVT